MRIFRWALVASAVLAAGSATAQAPAPSTTDTPWAAGRASVNVEALFMWFKSSPTPVPLVTNYYADYPGTTTYLGGGSIDTNMNPGFRLTGTYDVNANWGLEAVAFYMPRRTTTKSVSSDGSLQSTDLFLPFHNVNTRREDLTEISLSPIYAGFAQETFSNSLGGGEVNARWPMAPSGAWRSELLAGVRYLQLKEDYSFTTSSPDIPPRIPDIFDTVDQFNTSNKFLGVQVGGRATYDSGPWTATLVGKLALGSMKQQVSINGLVSTNDFNDYGPPQTFSGGYLALPTNSGNHSRNVFTAVPEVGLSLGYRITPAATLYAGYTFLYVNSVVRPGEQINRNINPSGRTAYTGDPPATPVGAADPKFSFNASEFWAQSVTLGFAYRF